MANQVILHGRFVFHVKIKLAVHGLKLGTQFIHKTIFFQIRPAVKGVTGDLHRVCLICLDFTERIVLSLKVTDDLRIYSAYKKAGLGEFPGYRLIIAAGALHDNTGLAIQISDQLLKGSEVSGQV